jgi:hypothetical protein
MERIVDSAILCSTGSYNFNLLSLRKFTYLQPTRNIHDKNAVMVFGLALTKGLERMRKLFISYFCA